MTITVKHKFVSLIPDSVDTGLVRPTNWNDDHDFTGTLPIANGGTNGTATPTAGAVPYGDGTAYAFTSVGTAGQSLISNGAGAPTWGTPAGSLAITNDTTTNSDFYPTFTSATSGTITGENVSSTKFTYHPSLGRIASTSYQGDFVDIRTTPTATVTGAVGRLWWDATGTLNIGMGNGNITQQVGEEFFVYGKASTAITDSPLKIVYQTGVVGASSVITFANTIAGITDGNAILGVATESIALNNFGRITSNGVVRGITTDGAAYGETWVDGDVIWYNPVTGNPTKVKPSAPNIKVSVGTIINAGSGGSGSIQVEVNHGSVLGGTDANVQITSVANKDLLVYDSTLGYWKNSPSTSVAVTRFSGGTTGFTPNTLTGGDVTLGGTLVIANGGTNGTATPTAGTVAYGTGTAYAFTSAGTANQVLVSNGSSAPSWANGSSITALTIVDDTTSGTTYKLAMTTASSGTINTEYVDSAELTFKTGVGHGTYTSQGLTAPSARFNGYLAIADTPTSAAWYAWEVYDSVGGGTLALYSPGATGTGAENITIGPKGWLTIGTDGNLAYPSIAPLYVAGPNNAPQIIINANNTQTHGLEISYDSSNNALLNNYNAANIAFGTNNTTKVTINSSGALGFTSTPSYGTSGQVLVSAGSGASPAWTNASSISANITITDDTATASVFYPTFTSATSGTITGEKVSSTNLQYTPSTGYLYSTKMQSTGYYLTGATAASGALYYSAATNRVTLANYNASGILVFEVNGGSYTAQFNADGSIQFLNIYAKNVTTAPKVVCMDSSGIIGYSTTADFTGATITATKFVGVSGGTF